MPAMPASLTMFRLHDLPAHNPRSRLVNVVVDTPKGSRNKYKYDEDAGVFKLSRILPAGMQFPHDFGSVPRTSAEDGDALDALVISEQGSFCGCLLNVRLLGVLRAVQTEKGKRIRNDRLIAIPQAQVNKPEARSLRDLDGSVLDEIEHFFMSYNHAQGREFKALGRLGVAEAHAVLKRGMRSFDSKVAKP